MSLADLIRGTPNSEFVGVATVTPATVATGDRVSTRSVASAATVTVANRAEQRRATEALTFRWRLHFAERDSREVAFAPALDHIDVLASYPDAIAAEPMPEPPGTAIPDDIAALFDRCERAGLYGDDDRAALPAMLALDEDATRALVRSMAERINRCRRCRHFRRPGLSDGYCTGRDDLPTAYGLLCELPDDVGTWCLRFEDYEA